MLQAVVFDFDGVLANSEPLHLQAFQWALADEGFSLSSREYYDHYVGLDDEAVLGRLARARAVERPDEWVPRLHRRKSAHLQALLSERSPLFAGAAACVRALEPRVPLAIASGAVREEIVDVLERCGLTDVFTAIVAAGETPQGKPAPDPYRAAVELLGAATGTRLEPAYAIAVEDSKQGLASARAAGLRTVALATTFPEEELLALADLVLPSIAKVTYERLSSLLAV